MAITIGQRVCHICRVTEPQFSVITTRAVTVRMALAAGLSPSTPLPDGPWVNICTACLHDAHRCIAESR